MDLSIVLVKWWMANPNAENKKIYQTGYYEQTLLGKESRLDKMLSQGLTLMCKRVNPLCPNTMTTL